MYTIKLKTLKNQVQSVKLPVLIAYVCILVFVFQQVYMYLYVV